MNRKINMLIAALICVKEERDELLTIAREEVRAGEGQHSHSTSWYDKAKYLVGRYNYLCSSCENRKRDYYHKFYCTKSGYTIDEHDSATECANFSRKKPKEVNNG